MHHCLQVVEILQNIFKFLRADHDAQLGTLANLALTCRTFQEPALDALWWSISSLDPLRRLMPDDLWDRVENSELRQVSRRRIEPSDFIRWSFYVGRVRKICDWARMRDDHVQFPIFHSSADSHFLAIPESYAIQFFPNLEQLDISSFVHGQPSQTPINAYLRPSLKDLRLFVKFPDTCFDALCEALRQTCPALEHFLCRTSSMGSPWPDFTPHPIPAFSKLVMELSFLKELRCPKIHIQDHVIHHLSQLPKLQILDIGNAVEDFVGCLRSLPRFSSPPFPNLHYLELMVEELCSATVDLVQVISSDIKQLTLKHNILFVPKEQHLHNFFQTLASTRWKKSLRFLSIQGEAGSATLESEVWVSPDYRVTPNTLKPLLALPELEDLDLDLEIAFELDNAMLGSMAQAWPNLSSLRIGGSGGTWGIVEGGAKITLDGLIPLVQCCPNLETLSICLDAVTAFPSPPRRPGRGAINEHVQSLHLCNSTISDPVEVASFLSDLFPNLLDVTAWSEGWMPTEDPDTEIEGWDEVNKLLPAFRNVRKQERVFQRVVGGASTISVPMEAD
ncbi:hypothetical protein D9758_007301 [Tetrapyrgos nigripes]|uniref:F-box domain-containing protein n=1 Tax=Tetrapyrgos nigripes TaxID=182062 RepID=A0A8H5LLL6_9AGAR|nr:hypothetical protein D9758_007301 [Tetrapyrgos nigripes]